MVAQVRWKSTREVGNLLGWIVALLMTGASLAYVSVQQFGPLKDQALQVDELFFEACAARGFVDGWSGVAGCHDNKAPLIYLLHFGLQKLGGLYSILALKCASGFMLGLLVALSAFIARRASQNNLGRAAAASVVLLVCALAPSPSLLAVKTEFLGTIFVLLALAFLPLPHKPINRRRAFAIGFAYGCAVMSKQTFALLLPVGVWSVWCAGQGLVSFERGTRLAWAGLGSLVPFAMLVSLYASADRTQEFLVTTFLYPAVYGNAEWPGLLRKLVWQFTGIAELLQFTSIHVVVFLLALLRSKWGAGQKAWSLFAILVMMSIGTIAILLVSPVLFRYHVLPFWVLGAILGGVVLSEIHGAGAIGQRMALATLLAVPILALGMTLRVNDRQPRASLDAPAMDLKSGRFAYVLGMEPEFYVRGFIPASSVQFPWALPHTPETWAYHYPKPGTLLAAALHAQQERNLVQLYRDFSNTPPAYILIIDAYAKKRMSRMHADVPGMDEYIDRHCRFDSPVSDGMGNPGKLFSCRVQAAGDRFPMAR